MSPSARSLHPAHVTFTFTSIGLEKRGCANRAGSGDVRTCFVLERGVQHRPGLAGIGREEYLNDRHLQQPVIESLVRLEAWIWSALP